MTDNPYKDALDQLALIHKLSLDAFAVEDKEACAFIILNDSIRVRSYDRALLFEKRGLNISLLGVSGQHTIDPKNPEALEWAFLLEKLRFSSEAQELHASSFVDGQDRFETIAKADRRPRILCVPLFIKGLVGAFLLIERWNNASFSQGDQQLFSRLADGYGPALARFSKPFSFDKPTRERFKKSLAVAVLFLLFFRVPLRVVAPCTVTAADPQIITAPLPGILEKRFVSHGDFVERGTQLFSYKSEAILRDVDVSEKQVAVAQAELRRAQAQELLERANADLAYTPVLKLRLEQERRSLAFAHYQRDHIIVTAEKSGYVSLESTDDWHGRPVRVGDHLLDINSSKETKLSIWLPEQDNIPLDPQKPIKIVLHVAPHESTTALISFVSDTVRLSPSQVPSFLVEASWETAPQDQKLGLKGVAILYGENVSVLYWLLRRPWTYLRTTFGI